jgi:hypothetical protein
MMQQIDRQTLLVNDTPRIPTKTKSFHTHATTCKCNMRMQHATTTAKERQTAHPTRCQYLVFLVYGTTVPGTVVPSYRTIMNDRIWSLKQVEISN